MNTKILQRNKKAFNDIKLGLKQLLDFCDEDRTPYVCALKQTKEGYDEIERFVLNGVVRQGLGISEALITYEKMLNPNAYVD